MVQRYGQDWEYEPSRIIMRENGPWVTHLDYANLEVDCKEFQQRLATAEAELEACQKLCAIYYEIAAAAIGEEQTIALRDAAMRRRRDKYGHMQYAWMRRMDKLCH